MGKNPQQRVLLEVVSQSKERTVTGNDRDSRSDVGTLLEIESLPENGMHNELDL